jgi:hypothetical protein
MAVDGEDTGGLVHGRGPIEGRHQAQRGQQGVVTRAIFRRDGLGAPLTTLYMRHAPGHCPWLCHGEHCGAEIDPQPLPAWGDEERCLEGHRPGTSHEIEAVLSWGQSGPPDELLHHGCEALIGLAPVDLSITLPNGRLPSGSFSVTIGRQTHVPPPCCQVRLSMRNEANVR